MGFIVIADFSHERVLQISLQTGSLLKLPITVHDTSGIAFDRSTKTLFYSDITTKTILFTSLHGKGTTLFYRTGNIENVNILYNVCIYVVCKAYRTSNCTCCDWTNWSSPEEPKLVLGAYILLKDGWHRTYVIMLFNRWTSMICTNIFGNASVKNYRISVFFQIRTLQTPTFKYPKNMAICKFCWYFSFVEGVDLLLSLWQLQ